MKNENINHYIKAFTNDLKDVWHDFCTSTSKILFLSGQAIQTLIELLSSKCDLFSGIKRLSILIVGIIKNILIIIGIIMIFLIPFILHKLEG